MKLTTSCEAAASKAASTNGSRSADATTTSTPATRSPHARANAADGSTPQTFATPRRSASTAVSAPVPQPTSSARIGGASCANATSADASCEP
jgi:hypothetical protein